MSTSPFLSISTSDWLLSNEHAFAIRDSYPINIGHALVVTKRLVATWFDATPAEQAAVMALVNELKAYLDQILDPRPDGYNVGFNCGEAAGQTVMHLHVHVIPRYLGDVTDPRGGVRFVIPDKANYLINASSARKFNSKTCELQLSTGYPNAKLWDQLSLRMAGARLIDVLASFVQPSGLDVIETRLFEVLETESSVRILVSDYLHISDPQALTRLIAWRDSIDEDGAGKLHVRLVEIAKLRDKPDSFHPKSWRIVDDLGAFIAVGSSNLSRAALVTGIEWNLLYSGHGEQGLPADFAREFNNLWEQSTDLTFELIKEYAKSRLNFRAQHFEPETLDIREVPEPRPWQLEALKSLWKIREAGYKRALVAVATGMGKTWLAAFDIRQMGIALTRRPRVLVIAHRSHILAQAEAAISTILDDEFGEGSTAWYIGSLSGLDGSLVIASIQKLSRPSGLERLAKEHFDYVVVDEVHHAHAPTYRRVLAGLNSDFILGLTATPERTDGVDVVSIFDDNLAHVASIGDGIAEDALVPFHYVGIRDTVDFQQIPWRNGRFDVDELELRVEASERMERLWKALVEHPAQRTIVFCCSRRHALFTRDWLRSKGLTSAAVFSGGGGDNYAQSLGRMRDGALETLCVVDMFNEGLDIPAVDRVVMLRPTESKVVFLQQLGRGLRASEGKSRLLVIDFVGNHRIFAQRIMHLLSLAGRVASWTDLKRWLNGEEPKLPNGCLLNVELEARDIIREFLPTGTKAGIEAYRAMRDELSRRPTPTELLNRGYLPRTISQAEGSWFGFCDGEGDLHGDEKTVFESFTGWLKTVETTSLNKSYKMVVVRVLLDHSLLFSSIDSRVFAVQCRRFMLNHPVLRRDLSKGQHAIDHVNASDEQWAEWWLKWPIDRWTDKQNGQHWFKLEDGRLKLTIECDTALRSILEAMTEELVDWRLAAYIKSHQLDAPEEGQQIFEGKVSHSNGRSILFVPEQTQAPHRPIGPTKVRLPDGSTWEFKFVKIACNVAHPVGQNRNQLSDLLRGWFGTDAGQPGTDFKVRFELSEGQWSVEPVGAIAHQSSIDGSHEYLLEDESFIQPVVPKSSQYKTHVPVYDLVVTAGYLENEVVPEAVGWIEVANRRLTPGMFVGEVIGHSMEPKIPSGSLCLFAPCPAGSRNGKLLLVQLNEHTDPEDGGRYTVKRYHSTKRIDEDGWQHETIEFQPLNPEFEPIVVRAEDAEFLRVLGEFICVVG